MFIHHLWGFPDRIAGGQLKYLFTVFDDSSIHYIAMFGKICVSIFFFIGGYGVYQSYANRRYELVKKLKVLYISYWKVFLIFIPLAFLFCTNQIAYCENERIWARYTVFAWRDCIPNFLGIRTSYNGEWWFLTSYVIALITFPMVRKAIQKTSTVTDILLVIIASIMVTNVFPALGNVEILGNLNQNYLYSNLICQSAPYIACFWMGAVVAKNALLDRLYQEMMENKMLNIFTDIVIWGIIIYLRQTGLGDKLDIFYIPLLIIVSLDFVNRIQHVRFVFEKIGNESTNMWLIHSFFCYYFYPVVRIVVAPRWAIPSLLILIVFTYVASVGVTYFWKMLSMGCQRVMSWMKIKIIYGKSVET